jgi:hypothetical protein
MLKKEVMLWIKNTSKKRVQVWCNLAVGSRCRKGRPFSIARFLGAHPAQTEPAAIVHPPARWSVRQCQLFLEKKSRISYIFAKKNLIIGKKGERDAFKSKYLKNPFFF